MTNTIKETKNNEAVVIAQGAEVAAILEAEVAIHDIVTQPVSIFEETQQQIFTSIKGTDRATNIKIYNAINSAENPLADHLGEIIEITDMVAHPIELEDDVTKELIKAMRVVLLTADGTAYYSVAGGVVGSLQKIIGIVGAAPWTPAIKVVPVEVKTRKGFKTITLKLQP